MAAASFTPATLAFLTELAQNNNRDWFGENKSLYESAVLDPALAFIQAMDKPLREIAPNYRAVPKRVGGSLMRVYRDTRFSSNKQPYKTNIGIQFRHELARDVHAPGFYVHIDPDRVFVGVGSWRPDSGSLAAYRQRIADEPGAWHAAIGGDRFAALLALEGDSLKRPPRGFDAAHPCIDDLKRKDFIAVRELQHADAISPGFVSEIARTFSAGAPLMEFLCRALDIKL